MNFAIALLTTTGVSVGTGLIAVAAGIAIGIAAGLTALGIGISTGKAFEATARQPEYASKISGLMFTGIVFMEACAIYALLISVLLLFVFGK